MIGIGLGWWWADAVAALFIAADVLHDGYRHTTAAIRDLIDEVPRSVDDKEIDSLPSDVQALVNGLPWVHESLVRLREEGRFVVGTIYVQPREERVDPHWVRDAESRVRRQHWRVHRVSVMPVPDLGDVGGAAQ